MNDINILYETKQWMLQDDKGRKFLVEKRFADDADRNVRLSDEENISGRDELIKDHEGYWLPARDVAKKNSDDYNPVYHVGSKTWVDIDDFEEIVYATIKALDLKPDYDVAQTFGRLRAEKTRERTIKPDGEEGDTWDFLRKDMAMSSGDQLMDALIITAKERFDGHLTIMKFTTNWRVCFGTPTDRDGIHEMEAGKSFEEAAHKALKSLKSVY